MVQENETNSQPATTTITDYLNGFQYKNNVLQYFPTSEGYVNFVLDPVIEDKGKYSYVYNYTDHLGNIRLSYAKNPVGSVLIIVEENHYYPFGLKHRGYNTGKQIFDIEIAELKLKPAPPYFRNGNNYKYNGKELQEELGLNWYDFGARLYMPDIIRTTTIDPLSEMFYDLSPQSFLNNNPLSFIDPTGMSSDDWKTNANGVMVYDKDLTEANASTRLGKDETYIGKSAYQENSNNTTTLYRENGTIDVAVNLDKVKIDGKPVESSVDINKVNKVADGVGLSMDTKELIVGMADGGEMSSAAKNMMKVTKVIGSVAGVVSAATSISGAIDNPTPGNITKAVINSALVFAGPVAGFVVGIMDATGASDSIYNKIDELVGQ